MPPQAHTTKDEGRTAPATDSECEQRRAIRSFVRREGRITPAQRRALDEFWPRFGLNLEDGPFDRNRTFGRTAPLCMEIGFGNGEALLDMATSHPEHDFIGVEVYRPGVGHLLLRLEASGLKNVRVYGDDAVAVLRRCIRDRILDAVFLYFPDPWPKKRHHKRRLVQPDFAELLAHKLKAGGIVHMATDWRDYAEHMLEVMDAHPHFENLSGVGRYSADRRWRPPSRFERRGRNLGHDVRDLIYRRTAMPLNDNTD